MEAKSEKGKIDRSEWQNILGRYESGETIARISRDYDCTAPAIRYIIKKCGKLGQGGSAKSRVEPLPDQGGGMRLPQDPPPAKLSYAKAVKRAPQTPTKMTGSAMLDSHVLTRVTGDIAFFLVALDRAEASDPESLTVLQGATDSLMRAIARIRIELDRAAWRRRPGLLDKRKIGHLDVQ